MPPRTIHRGRFLFRFELLANDELRVWFETEAGDVGPVTLYKAEADELGALLERALELFTTAHERGQHSPVAPPSTALSVEAASPLEPAAPQRASKAPALQAPRRRRRPLD